jgi:hypothetical protein
MQTPSVQIVYVQHLFGRNDECRESPDFGGYGINVYGRWYHWPIVTQEGLGVME